MPGTKPGRVESSPLGDSPARTPLQRGQGGRFPPGRPQWDVRSRVAGSIGHQAGFGRARVKHAQERLEAALSRTKGAVERGGGVPGGSAPTLAVHVRWKERNVRVKEDLESTEVHQAKVEERNNHPQENEAGRDRRKKRRKTWRKTCPTCKSWNKMPAPTSRASGASEAKKRNDKEPQRFNVMLEAIEPGRGGETRVCRPQQKAKGVSAAYRC